MVTGSLNDPTNQLVHTEEGGAVRHVMIGGRMIVEDRPVTTVDVAALARQAEAACVCPGLAHMPYHVNRDVAGP